MNTEKNPPSSDQLAGIYVFILSFLTVAGPIDQLFTFTKLDADTHHSVISDYHSNGISFVVSGFGDSDAPTTNGDEPIATANTIADFVMTYGVRSHDL
jgi:hypothetical protein